MTENTNQLLSEQEAAKDLTLKVKTLQSWRHQKINLPFIKVGRNVRYRKSDIEAYLANQRVEVSQ